MILSNRSNIVSGSSPRHKDFDAFSLIILPLKGLSGVLGRYDNDRAYLPCMCCRVKPWTIPEGVRHTPRPECACAWKNYEGGNLILILFVTPCVMICLLIRTWERYGLLLYIYIVFFERVLEFFSFILSCPLA